MLAIFEACNIPDASDPFADVDDDGGFVEEDPQVERPNWEDPAIVWPEDAYEGDAPVEDTDTERFSKTMLQYKKTMKEMEEIMVGGGIPLAEHGVAEMRLLVSKMRTLHVNSANARLHPHTSFSVVDNGLPNQIGRQPDWFERMTRNKRSKRNTRNV